MQVFGKDKTLVDTLDGEVRADVEAAARLLSKRVAVRCRCWWQCGVLHGPFTPQALLHVPTSTGTLLGLSQRRQACSSDSDHTALKRRGQ